MIEVVIGIVILGVALYFVEAMLPIAQPIKIVIRVLVVLIVLVLLLRVAGILIP